jgi:hypothetical protein
VAAGLWLVASRPNEAVDSAGHSFTLNLEERCEGPVVTSILTIDVRKATVPLSMKICWIQKRSGPLGRGELGREPL